MKELCQMYSLSFQFCVMQCIKNEVIISRCDMECTNLKIAGSNLIMFAGTLPNVVELCNETV